MSLFGKKNSVIKIDLKTYSGFDIKVTGIYKYVEHPDFKILLILWKYEDGKLHTWDYTTGLPMPQELECDLMNPDITKYAYNASFVIACLKKKYLPKMPVDCWCDGMFTLLYNGLSTSVVSAGKVLGLNMDIKKDIRGKILTRRFCAPDTYISYKGYIGNNWHEFIDYSQQDVATTFAVLKTLKLPLKYEQQLWLMNYKINVRGVKIDRQFIDNAIKLLNVNTDILKAEATEIMLENPRSITQLMSWFTSRNINETVSHVKRMFKIWQTFERTGFTEYLSIRESACLDGRLHGLFQIYGEPSLQLQNLKCNIINNLDEVRQAVKSGYIPKDLNVIDTLKQLISTALIPARGKLFIIAGYINIDACVLAWIIKEDMKDIIKLADDEITEKKTLSDTLEWAAFHALQHKGQKYGIQKCWFLCHDDGNLYMHLPSGREICYRNTYIYKNKYEQPIIGYWGSELLKDLIQAISRDILLNAMLRLDACYDIVMYTNNEIVIEHATDALYDIMMRMSQYESWMQGLALHVDGFICNYYKTI